MSNRLKKKRNEWHICSCGKKFISVTGVMGCEDTHKRIPIKGGGIGVAYREEIKDETSLDM
jgi:hypothetical protein